LARGLAVAALLLLAGPDEPARADEIVADLSSHVIAISSGFNGASVVLFGAIDGPGDVVAVMRGPAHPMTVWRKGKTLGIWVNAEEVTFTEVPSYYAVAASRPLDELLRPEAAARYRIGAQYLQLGANAEGTPERIRRFAAALLVEQQRAGLFAAKPGQIARLGDRLFRATFEFPANVPTGAYLAEVFLVRGGDVVVAGRTTPLHVFKVGVDAAVFDFATQEPVAYGAIAVLTAVVAGWLGSLPFRGF
jgi:uncharacterized protein (TIGR02186 family)